MNKVNQTTYTLIFKELLEGPLSAHEAAEISGIHVVTANSLFRCFKRHKVVYISSWETDRMGRDMIPIYEIGNKPDKKRRRQTNAERSATYKAKKKALEIVNLTTNMGATPAISK